MGFAPWKSRPASLPTPAVFECAVVGATDKDDLVKPKAFIV